MVRCRGLRTARGRGQVLVAAPAPGVVWVGLRWRPARGGPWPRRREVGGGGAVSRLGARPGRPWAPPARPQRRPGRAGPGRTHRAAGGGTTAAGRRRWPRTAGSWPRSRRARRPRPYGLRPSPATIRGISAPAPRAARPRTGRPGLGVGPDRRWDQGEPGVDAQSFRRGRSPNSPPGLLQPTHRRPRGPVQPQPGSACPARPSTATAVVAARADPPPPGEASPPPR